MNAQVAWPFGYMKQRIAKNGPFISRSPIVRPRTLYRSATFWFLLPLIAMPSCVTDGIGRK